uniref:Uncharacterized protein n=1 Tax=Glossina palpalis gambiensis TaxID=67801 RepID=A0A1B0AXY7_9MUSC
MCEIVHMQAGQYGNQIGDNWELCSGRIRIPNMQTWFLPKSLMGYAYFFDVYSGQENKRIRPADQSHLGVNNNIVLLLNYTIADKKDLIKTEIPKGAYEKRPFHDVGVHFSATVRKENKVVAFLHAHVGVQPLDNFRNYSADAFYNVRSHLSDDKMGQPVAVAH